MRMQLIGWPRDVTARPADLYAALGPLLLSLLLIALVTAALALLQPVIGLTRVSIVYLIPVMISATRWGPGPAVVTAIAAAACADFFFYPPLYSLHIDDPKNILDLVLFVLVAIVTGYLASSLRRQAARARRQESDIRDLYAFSRRLMQCESAADIHAAIEEHLSRTLRHRAILIGTTRHGQQPLLPDEVRHQAAVIAAHHQGEGGEPGAIVAQGQRRLWLVRPVSAKTPEFGMVAVDLGSETREQADAIAQRVDAMLGDAAAMLERLDLARAINDAKLRAEANVLRQAIIGSVSHELRTPLASILGAASVMQEMPAVGQDRRLATLAEQVRDEAEHLNSDIQNLLDAARISAEGVRPNPEWVDPVDIVNVAVERRRRRLAEHPVEIDVAPDLPLLRVDPVLVEQAFGQVLGNAAKYSPAGSPIRAGAYRNGSDVVLFVRDEGAGLTPDEKGRLGERSFRGRRHEIAVTGSGLGLWIAQSFVAANGGRIEAESAGEGRGTTVAMRFPIPETGAPQEPEQGDE